ncbi:hypothetical protein B0T26DRAFT_313013 [Lasiosphaeria miniovina]|uniref:Uncharacterized protein n=1 Tax=Lasiosphaeria miniovina TaxID=1954250 RepID=A0AA40DVQ0_9PEZI|nr:uncharacterized protein B0T26DRAFT_313013 [Lasiosphaeria miniovina]KAK0718099.1 hypothetical protein B0T26DRAFT_313013 [Lasiosphaeria miniovina]
MALLHNNELDMSLYPVIFPSGIWAAIDKMHLPRPFGMDSFGLNFQDVQYSVPLSPETIPSSSSGMQRDDYFSPLQNSNKISQEGQGFLDQSQLVGSVETAAPSGTSLQRPVLQARTSQPPPVRKSSTHGQVSFSASNYTPTPSYLSPQPLGDLDNERAYLVSNLHQQSDKATKNYERYVALEAQLPEAQKGSETRKVKRKMSSLRNKIGESSQQEQLVLLRLGEIFFESQKRQHKQQQQQNFTSLQQVLPMAQFPPMAEASPFPTTSSSAGTSSDYFTPSSALSPLSPAFVPGAITFSEDIWGEKPAPGKPIDEPQTIKEERKPETAGGMGSFDEAMPDAIGNCGEFSERVEYNDDRQMAGDSGTEEAQIDDVMWDFDGDDSEQAGVDKKRQRLSSLSLPLLSPSPREKRMSMPSLKNLWPKSWTHSSQPAS